MADEQKTQLRLEIGHVLFMDIVGYSKLLTEEQSEALHELNQIIRITEAVREAEAAGQLIILPTGDGMALVFTRSVEEPVECALQISQALRAQPSLLVRMGIHSGPVHHAPDVNHRQNIAGAGINIAQRVMDCGDAGHILVSKRVADDLAQYRRWQPYLHELGDFEVKHGVIVSLVNFYADTVGNPEPPARLKYGKSAAPRAMASGRRKRLPFLIVLVVIGLMFFSLAVLGIIFAPAILKQIRAGKTHVPQATSADGSAVSADGGQPGAPSLPVPEKSIAVLPFENLSNDKENAFFADGVQDEILTDLAKVADLKVISRTSVIGYRDTAGRNLRKIGQELGVAHLLEGSVQRANNRVRVNAQLIDARNDAHLWAQTYDRDLADVFAIQSEIAQTIAEQLQARLSPSERAAIAKAPTTDLVANDLYIRARQLGQNSNDPGARKDLLEAALLLDQAVARDPNFWLACCLLSEVHLDLYWGGFDHTDSRRNLARLALERAERIQPDAGEVHLERAVYAYHGFRDYDRARKELELARRVLPNSSKVYMQTGAIDRRQGRFEESLRNFDRGAELDPRNLVNIEEAGFTRDGLRRFAEAKVWLERALAIAPNDYFLRTELSQLPYYERGDTAAWRAQLDAIYQEGKDAASHVALAFVFFALAEHDAVAAARALEVTPAEGAVSPYDNYLLPREWFVGLIARSFGDNARAQSAFTAARTIAQKMVTEQPDYAPGWSLLGLIDAGLGRKAEAMTEGKRACELLPLSKDAWDAPSYILNLAMIYAWVGEKDLALEQLAVSANTPPGITYGELKRSLVWDPLRGDPRFEQIVASLAPKN
jgi:TolB-like protein/Flp pilus assembly protein TadD